MDTIEGYESDESASTRIAVWTWTLGYVADHPLGGGFETYRQNKLNFQTIARQASGNVEVVAASTLTDEGRAFHSSYFEMLGEQGWPGLFMWLSLHLVGLFRMEMLRRRYRKAGEDKAWIAGLATSVQHAHFLYLVGSLFVGIAFQSFAYMWIAVEIGLEAYCRRMQAAEGKAGWGGKPAAKPAAAGAL